MPPRSKVVNEEAVQRLVKLYRETTESLLAEFDNVTDVSRARRVALIANVDEELRKLGVETAKWADKEIPSAYKMGTQDAVVGIERLISAGAIGKEVLSTKTFTTINKDAVEAMLSDTSRAFAENLTGVGRSIRSITTEAYQREVKAKLAEGVVSGTTRKELADQLKQSLKDRGLTGVVDKSGKQWRLEHYADMLARTKLTEAVNTGTANKMLENGMDLVQVSVNGSTHPACADYEGEILSLTGKTSGYTTVDEATADGLFHPNCQHRTLEIEPELARETFGWNTDTGTYEKGIIE